MQGGIGEMPLGQDPGHDHRIEQDQAPHPPRRLGRGHEGGRPPHGMPRQDDILRIEALEQGQQVIAKVEPVGAALHGGGKGGGAMTALVHGQDPAAAGQRLKNPAIGEGVEPVGVQEDQIDRPIRRPKVQGRQGALTAMGQQKLAAHAGLETPNSASACRFRPGPWPAG